ncbi:MAG: glycosyltransferase family 1 protein [Pseudomonadota bacterium]
MSLKLGIDARPLEHPRNGIGRYTTQIIEQIRQRTDWRLHLFTSAHNELRMDGVEIEQVADFLSFNAAAFQFKLARTVERRGLDGYFSPRHHLPIGLKVPSIVTIHDMVWHKFPQTMNPAGMLLERLFMPPSIKRADAIIAVSESTAAEVVDMFPQAAARTHVIYEAGSTFDGPVTVGPAPVVVPFILAVGTIEPRKNYYRLLSAFDLIADEHSDVHLVIVGGRGWRMDVDQLLAGARHRTRVRVLDQVDDEMLQRLYYHCEFLAVPSLYEGFCLPLVEAMSFGKAVLTGQTSAMPEIAGAAGVLVDPHDVQSIAQGLRALLYDERLRTSKGHAAAQRSAQFSWDLAGSQTVDLIAATVDRA